MEKMRVDHDRCSKETLSSLKWRKVVLWSICFAFFFMPERYALGTELYRIWQASLIAISVVFAITFLATKRIRLGWVCLVAMYFTYFILSTIVESDPTLLRTGGFQFLIVLGFLSMGGYCLTEDKRMAVLSFIIGGTIMSTFNWISYVEYRDVIGGMQAGVIDEFGRSTTQHWFLLGHDNSSFFLTLPVIASCWYYVNKYNRKMIWCAIPLNFAQLYMYVDLQSATALIGLIVFTAACLLVTFIGPFLRIARFAVKHYRILLCVLFLGVTLAPAITQTPFFQDMLLSSPEKTYTIGQRVNAWTLSFDAISQSPVLGYGVESKAVSMERIGLDHCHNMILQIIYGGGFVALSFYAVGLISCCPRVCKRACDVRSSAILVFAVCAYFLCSSFDWMIFYQVPLYIFMLLDFDGRDVSSEDVIDRDWA